MTKALIECPRHDYQGEHRGIRIDSSNIKDKEGNEVVNCSACAFANNRGVCKYYSR